MSADELEDFFSESRELIASAEKALLAVENGLPFGQAYDAIFRVFHTIKGLAGMLDMVPLQTHVHQLESLLVSVKSEATLPRGCADVLLRGCDATLRLLNGETVTFDYGVGPVAAPVGELPTAVAPATAPPSEMPVTAAPSASAATPDVVEPESGPNLSSMHLDADGLEFLAECDEAVQRVCDALLRVDSGQPTDATLVDQVYRDVHTVKGGAQLFGLRHIAETTHALETVLESIRQRHSSFEISEVDPILKPMTQVQQWINQLRQNNTKKPTLTSQPAVSSNTAPAAQVQHSVEAPAPLPSAEVVAAAKQSPDSVDSSVRVPVALLDRLMASMGEMVLVRNQVLQFASKSDDFEFLRLSQRLDVVTSEIQGEVMKTRMQPVANVLLKFQRIVRDLSRSLAKKINLNLVGTETELDKTLLETVKDPLMHIVRNACDHGIETPEVRKALSKPESGQITIRSYQEGGQVAIEVSDDGHGLDRDALLKKAIEKKLVTPDAAYALSDREVYALIFVAGFSTATKVTNVSGRGVGMDVVKSNIEKIGGIIEIESKPNLGMTIRLKIPLTVAILPAMIIRSDTERYAIPQVKVVELLRIAPGPRSANKIEMLQGKPLYRLRGTLLPLLSLKEILGLSNLPPKELLDAGQAINIIVVRAEKKMFGIMVEEVQDKADIVVKPISSFLKSVTTYCGATVLGDGAIALILDISGIAQRHHLSLGDTVGNELASEMDPSNEAQELLLFKIEGRQERYAVPLNLVHRLEEIKAASIEFSGDQRVVRYRGGILPILSLRELMALQSNQTLEAIQPANATLDPRLDVIRVVVISKAGRLFGFEIKEILDVLSSTDVMDDAHCDRSTILGNLLCADGMVVIVDMLRIVDDCRDKLSVNTLEATPAAASQATTPAVKTRILFADDTTFFRKHVRSVLEKAGYQVDTAVNGRDALSQLEAAPVGTYQIVLSDIEMPVMDGLTLARQLRAHPQLCRTPLLALTTHFSPKFVEEGRAAGYDAYLEKLNADVLLAELQKILRQPASSSPAIQVAQAS